MGLCSAQRCVELCGLSHVPSSSPSYTLPPCLGHIRLSLLAALKRDGPGWNTPTRLAHSQIYERQMSDNVHEHYHLFSYYYYFLVEHSNMYILSIDCYNLFRLINHKKAKFRLLRAFITSSWRTVTEAENRL